MFITLLTVTLLLAVIITALIVRLLAPSIRGILTRLVGDQVASHWQKFTIFALYISGVSHGVDLYRLERYIQKTHEKDVIPPLTLESWIFELYQVVERTLGGLTWAAMTVFVISLIAFIIVRGFEMSRQQPKP
ncbi:MAG TPA: hypothetical protein VF585_04480 [Chthoniobacterales bacterium]|jgi:hypothetical protein